MRVGVSVSVSVSDSVQSLRARNSSASAQRAAAVTACAELAPASGCRYATRLRVASVVRSAAAAGGRRHEHVHEFELGRDVLPETRAAYPYAYAYAYDREAA